MLQPLLSAIGTVTILTLAAPVAAQPNADQVLADLGFGDDARRQVLAGDFVSSDVSAVSNKDLSISMAFIVKASPAEAMLLARLQAYQSSGLAGIAPYARADGNQSDAGNELRKASAAVPELKKYLPALEAVLLGYPQATLPAMQQQLFWVSYDIDGTPTYALTHELSAPDGDARVIVQRQFDVSAGYNAEQALVALLPIQEGTLVAYLNHTFTDQVSGFGGSMKRSIGRRLMVSKLKKVFEQARARIKHSPCRATTESLGFRKNARTQRAPRALKCIAGAWPRG